MRLRWIATWLVVPVCCANCGAQAGSQQTADSPAAAASQSPAGSPDAGVYVTVPAGTVIPLNLVTPILKKSSKPGNPARATVAFPITAGGQLAIPAGTYVEGTIESVGGRDRLTHLPQVKMHFTRLLFANGYSVPLDAMSMQAERMAPRGPATTEDDDEAATDRQTDGAPGASAFVSRQSTQPRLPPAPSLGGPSPAVVGAATAGGAAALTTVLYLLHRHRDDYVLLDAGWPFQITTRTPIALNVALVQAAIKSRQGGS